MVNKFGLRSDYNDRIEIYARETHSRTLSDLKFDLSAKFVAINFSHTHIS